MRVSVAAAGLLAFLAVLSCAPNGGAARAPGEPTPGGAPGIGTVPPPTVPTGGGSAAQSTTSSNNAPPADTARPGGRSQGGPPGGFRRRAPLTPEQMAARRDSLDTARTQVIQELMTRIAGSEDRRADDEFTNIKLMKDTTAAQLLKQMDYYGKSLSVGCSYCHVPDKWDEDTKEEKQTARVMIQLVNLINNDGLSKLPPGRSGRTPKISCIACHHGRTKPGEGLLP